MKMEKFLSFGASSFLLNVFTFSLQSPVTAVSSSSSSDRTVKHLGLGPSSLFSIRLMLCFYFHSCILSNCPFAVMLFIVLFF